MVRFQLVFFHPFKSIFTERLLGAGLSNAKAKCSLYLILPRRTNDSIFRNFVTFSPNAKTKGPPDPKKIIGLVGVAEGGVYC